MVIEVILNKIVFSFLVVLLAIGGFAPEASAFETTVFTTRVTSVTTAAKQIDSAAPTICQTVTVCAVSTNAAVLYVSAVSSTVATKGVRLYANPSTGENCKTWNALDVTLPKRNGYVSEPKTIDATEFYVYMASGSGGEAELECLY